MATNLGSLAVFLTADTRKYKKGMTSAQKTMAKFSKAVTVGLTVASAAMIAFSVKSIKAFTVQEDALEGVKAALRANSDEVENNAKRLAKFASEMQKVTVFGDELILKQIALQRNLGVSADKLEESAKMTIGLAAATGKNIDSLAQYVALAQQGEFTMLRRYIPALRQTTDETEQLKIVTEFAANGFKVAQENAKTTSGSLKQLANSWGDLQESIGSVLVQLLSIKDASGGAKNSIEQLTASLKKNSEDIVFSFKFIVINAKASLTQLWNLVKNIGNLIVANTAGVMKIISKVLDATLKIAMSTGKNIWKALISPTLGIDYAALAKKHKKLISDVAEQIVETSKKSRGLGLLDGVGEIERQRAEAIAKLYKDAEDAGDKAAKSLKDNLIKAKVLNDTAPSAKQTQSQKQDAVSPIIGAVLKGTSEALKIEARGQKSKEVEKNTKKTADNTEKIAFGIDTLVKQITATQTVDVFGGTY